jgi:aminomethyltransferase
MEIKKTGFYDIPPAAGRQAVEFAGYYMPIQYRGNHGGASSRALHRGVVRSFPMGEFFVAGAQPLPFLQKMTTNDVAKLAIHQVQYSTMVYEKRRHCRRSFSLSSCRGPLHAGVNASN